MGFLLLSKLAVDSSNHRKPDIRLVSIIKLIGTKFLFVELDQLKKMLGCVRLVTPVECNILPSYTFSFAASLRSENLISLCQKKEFLGCHCKARFALFTEKDK